MNKILEICIYCIVIWLSGVIISYAIKSYKNAKNDGYGKYYIKFSDDDLFDIWLWPIVVVILTLRSPFWIIETIAIHIKKAVDKINNPIKVGTWQEK